MSRQAQAPEEPGDGLAALALFETIATKLSTNPFLQSLELTGESREAIVGEPADEEGIEFADHLGEANAPITAGNLLDLILGTLDAFG